MTGFDNIIKLVSDEKEYKIHRNLLKKCKLLSECIDGIENDYIFVKDRVMYLDIDSISLDFIVKYLRGYPMEAILKCYDSGLIEIIKYDANRLGIELVANPMANPPSFRYQITPTITHIKI